MHVSECSTVCMDVLYIRRFHCHSAWFAPTQYSSKIAVEENCSRMNWQVAPSNSRAAVLYDRIGGKCLREWKNYRLKKDVMEMFAQGTPQLKGGMTIRKATKEDVPIIVSMIKVQ